MSSIKVDGISMSFQNLLAKICFHHHFSGKASDVAGRWGGFTRARSALCPRRGGPARASACALCCSGGESGLLRLHVQPLHPGPPRLPPGEEGEPRPLPRALEAPGLLGFRRLAELSPPVSLRAREPASERRPATRVPGLVLASGLAARPSESGGVPGPRALQGSRLGLGAASVKVSIGRCRVLSSAAVGPRSTSRISGRPRWRMVPPPEAPSPRGLGCLPWVSS